MRIRRLMLLGTLCSRAVRVRGFATVSGLAVAGPRLPAPLVQRAWHGGGLRAPPRMLCVLSSPPSPASDLPEGVAVNAEGVPVDEDGVPLSKNAIKKLKKAAATAAKKAQKAAQKAAEVAAAGGDEAAANGVGGDAEGSAADEPPAPYSFTDIGVLMSTATAEEQRRVYAPIRDLGTPNYLPTGEEVWVRGRLSKVRAAASNCFLVLRAQGQFSVQAVFFKDKTTPAQSKAMLSALGGLTEESIVDVRGKLVEAQVTACSQSNVELQIIDLVLISSSLPKLPFEIDDAGRTEADILASEGSERPFPRIGQARRRACAAAPVPPRQCRRATHPHRAPCAMRHACFVRPRTHRAATPSSSTPPTSPHGAFAGPAAQFAVAGPARTGEPVHSPRPVSRTPHPHPFSRPPTHCHSALPCLEPREARRARDVTNA